MNWHRAKSSRWKAGARLANRGFQQFWAPVVAGVALLLGMAEAQFFPGLDPRLPDAPAVESLPAVEAGGGPGQGEGEVLVEQFRGIWLESWEEAELISMGAFLSASEGLVVPSPLALEAKLKDWEGRSLTEGELVAIADMILIHYDVEGYPVVGLEVPEQDFSTGVVRFFIEVGRIGKFGVSTPKWGDPVVIRKGLTLQRGQLLTRKALDEQMAWYGRTVFRRPRLFVSPGDEPATADLLIGLEEAKPWKASLGYENSGPDSLGEDRFLLGVAGMTRNEHVLSWQTVVGAPVSSLWAHALSWQIPFHRIHQTLQIDAAYAKVRTILLNNGVAGENTGTSWSLAAMQKIALPPMGKWRHSFSAGIDVKGTDQFVLFGALPFSPGEVRFVDARLTYALDRSWDDGGFSMATSLVMSPGGVISGNDDEDFRAYNPFADANYTIGRIDGQGWWSPGGDWRVGLRGKAQASDSHLLPAEQFAIGGYRTVRGVPELEYLGSDGLQGSLEMYTPQWAPHRFCSMRFLGFLDYGWVGGRVLGSESATGAGLGVRMKVSNWVDLRLDHGWRLDQSGSRFHVGFRATY